MRNSLAAGCAVFAIVVGVSAKAHAVDAAWCEKYANRAVAQYNEANGFNNCRRNDGRWHRDWRVHFQWCRQQANSDVAVAEDRARLAHLNSGCKASRM